MLEFNPKIGQEVIYQQKRCKIVSPLSLESVLLEQLDMGEQLAAKLVELSPHQVDASVSLRKDVLDLFMVSETAWQEAKRRKAIIEPLAHQTTCTLFQAKEAGSTLGLSWRQVYYLISRYRKYGFQLLALLPLKPPGGKGKNRIDHTLESIIQNTIDEIYLNNQQNKISHVVEEVHRRCHRANLIAPSARTIRRRIDLLTSQYVMKKRGGTQAANNYFKPVTGTFPITEQPHAVWQIDHTLVDLVIVDESYRLPLGRPYITIAIDVFSRCITGFTLSLEPPSATSVGLCLTHAIFDKEQWLLERKIETSWPIWGKPAEIFVANAAEFHSEALERGCDTHGIKLNYRPVGTPHFGGIVERLMRTLMELVHQLPGTTFSNIQKRGKYNSDKQACLTFSEFEYWLTLAITEYYHQKIHKGIELPPIERYRQGILGSENKPGYGYPIRIEDKKMFLIDFLPIVRRTIQRYGFKIDHINYYNHCLSPLIANRDKQQPFIIRRDPRDLSRIYVFDPSSRSYLEIPYRTLSRPTITLWEHRRAMSELSKRGIKHKDERIIFNVIEKLRIITKQARTRSRSARRQHERLQHVVTLPENENSQRLDNSDKFDDEPIEAYKDIELW